jgi:hypothetical protein
MIYKIKKHIGFSLIIVLISTFSLPFLAYSTNGSSLAGEAAQEKAAQKKAAQEKAAQEKAEEEAKENEIREKENMFSNLIFVINVAMLLLVLYLIKKLGRDIKIINHKIEELQIHDRLREQNTQDNNLYKPSQYIKTLEAKIEVLTADIKDIKERMLSVSNTKINDSVVVDEQNYEKATGLLLQKHNYQNEESKLYAKYTDLENGFSKDTIKTTQDGEQVYEIALISENKARYKVSSDINAQRFALSNPEIYLNIACDADSLPQGKSEIQTKEVGELEMNGKNWIINKKAKIRYQ